MKRPMILGLAVMLLAGGLLALIVAQKRRGEHSDVVQATSIGSEVDPEWKKQGWIEDYQLTERSGRTFDSIELAGQVHVVSFFFAMCPGPCLRQNQALQVVQAAYAPKGVTFLSITCDPKRDTPPVLRNYARQFNADPQRWLFLTGELSLIRRIGAEKYNVPVDEMSHTEAFLVYDKSGEMRGKFNWKDPEKLAEMRVMLDQLLAEEPPKADDKADASEAEASKTGDTLETDTVPAAKKAETEPVKDGPSTPGENE